MEAEEEKVPSSTKTADPPMIQPTAKSPLMVIQNWPISRKIATVGVLLLSILLFGFLIFKAGTADHQLLYANLSVNDASSISDLLKTREIAYSLKNG
ncbi:MAG: hypothetical protein JRC87_12055, partial [Deltaproteobacteria bacterium]|nr:hypothetical protein [Deltaproteobacteria bacterium]